MLAFHTKNLLNNLVFHSVNILVHIYHTKTVEISIRCVKSNDTCARQTTLIVAFNSFPLVSYRITNYTNKELKLDLR